MVGISLFAKVAGPGAYPAQRQVSSQLPQRPLPFLPPFDQLGLRRIFSFRSLYQIGWTVSTVPPSECIAVENDCPTVTGSFGQADYSRTGRHSDKGDGGAMQVGVVSASHLGMAQHRTRICHQVAQRGGESSGPTALTQSLPAEVKPVRSNRSTATSDTRPVGTPTSESGR
jgi:hypothetical protein